MQTQQQSIVNEGESQLTTVSTVSCPDRYYFIMYVHLSDECECIPHLITFSIYFIHSLMNNTIVVVDNDNSSISTTIPSNMLSLDIHEPSITTPGTEVTSREGT